MYVSVILSTILIAGLCLGALVYVSDFKTTNVNDIIAIIFEKAINKHIGFFVGILAIVCMLTTTFISYLATIRYAYGLPELNFIRDGGDGNVSYISIILISILCMIGIFINQTASLVELSDVGLIITLLLVSMSAFYEKYQKGYVPVSDGLTSGGLLGILGLTVKKHFF